MKAWIALALVLAFGSLGGAAGIMSQGQEATVSGQVTWIFGCHMLQIQAENGSTYRVGVYGWWEGPNGTLNSCILVSEYVSIGEEVTVTGYLRGWGHGHHGGNSMLVAMVITLDEGVFERVDSGSSSVSLSGTVSEVNITHRFLVLDTANGTYNVKVTGWWQDSSGGVLFCTGVLAEISVGDQVTVYGYQHGSWIMATQIDTSSESYTRLFGHGGFGYSNQTATITGTIETVGCRAIRLSTEGGEMVVVIKGIWMDEEGNNYTPCQLTSTMQVGGTLSATGYVIGDVLLAVSLEFNGETYVQLTPH